MNDTLKNIFQTLSENAEENFVKHKNADDYLAEDGLWHCGKCDTAKQFRLPERFMKMGMPEIVGCCCACQSAKEKRGGTEGVYEGKESDVPLLQHLWRCDGASGKSLQDPQRE